MKKMREARKGDRALVLPGGCDPEHEWDEVRVTSDPEYLTYFIRWGGKVGRGWVNDIEHHSAKFPIICETRFLLPIDPDDDTRRQFEEESVQDRIDKVRKTADTIGGAVCKPRSRT